MEITHQDMEMVNEERNKKLNVKEMLSKKDLTPFELDLIMNDA